MADQPGSATRPAKRDRTRTRCTRPMSNTWFCCLPRLLVRFRIAIVGGVDMAEGGRTLHERHVGDGRDPQGSVDRTLRRGAPGLVLDRPALRDGGGLLLPGRHPRRPAPAARRRELELARPPGLALRRPRRDLAGDAERRRPLPGGHRRGRRPRLAADARAPRTTSCTPAPSPARSSGRPTAARPSSSSAACGTTPSARSGTPATAARPSTRSCPTPRSRRRCSPRSRPAASTAPTTAAARGTRRTPA